MKRIRIYAALAAAGTCLVGAHSAPLFAELTPEQLAALDPTLAGRKSCVGIATPGAALDKRLALAKGYSAALGMGAASIPLYAGLAQSQLPVGGISGQARQFFDQGMALAYGFNHAAAIRSFKEGLARDETCAMCYWGIAMASGPNINSAMSPAQNAEALSALKMADIYAKPGSPEAELIAVQKLRFSADPAAERGTLDAAYADAMMKLAAAHPENDDIAVLAAESAMTTTPWYYWDDETKAPQPRIAEAVALIQGVVGRNPTHPQASHLYIHLMENSADPHIAEVAADTLAGSGPQALGHLVHMPSHIYYRIGRYADSMTANVKGARADEQYLQTVGDDGLYRFGYYPHNVHFLLTSAQMVGNMHAVMQETQRLEQILDADIARELAWVQAIHAAPSFALAQFASPSAILALTEKPSPLAYVEGMRHYARAVAYVHGGNEAGYAKEMAALKAAASHADVESMREQGFPAPDLIKLAMHVAQGKHSAAMGNFEEAVAHYEMAEKIEATIPYNEPPYWYYPVAQSRGAALYRLGDYDGAVKAFRKALFVSPSNGWALYGLAQAEAKAGHAMEAAAAKAKLDEVWQGKPEWLDMKRL